MSSTPSTPKVPGDVDRWAFVFDALHDGVVVMDPKGRVVDWNAGAEQMFGYAKDEMLGQTPRFLRDLTTQGPTEAEMGASLRQSGRWAGEVSIRRKDGTLGVCDTVIVAQRDASGAVVGLIAVNRDATTRREAEALLRESGAPISSCSIRTHSRCGCST
jgi:PAS domain S-box-containing protein